MQSQSNYSELPPETELEDVEEAEGEEAEGPELLNSDDDGEDLLDGMERCDPGRCRPPLSSA